MKKIRTCLKIVPILLLSMPTLASQEEIQVCRMRWGQILPNIICSSQPLTVQQTKYANTENPSASSARREAELRRLKKMTLFL